MPSELTNNRRIRGVFIVSFILVVVLILGFTLADHYGQSWDDGGNAEYGMLSLQAYMGSSDFMQNAEDRYYGPLHFMTSALAVKFSNHVFPEWHPVDVRHFMNYSAFVVSVVALYALLRSFTGKLAAVITTVLFATQPVLFGQAFINQKDIPFMALFCLAFLIGIRAVEHSWSALQTPKTENKRVRTLSDLISSIRHDWGALNIRVRVITVFIGLLVFLFLLDIMAKLVIFPQMEELVRDAYEGHAWSPLQLAFNRIAQDAYKTPIDLYLDQLQVVYNWIRVPACLAAIAFLVVIVRKGFDNTWRNLGWKRASWHTAFGLAGLALGAATAIRVAAPLAGILVTLYLFVNMGRRGIGPAIVYWSVAAVFTYLTWPFLWWDPIGHFLETIQIMGNFPTHAVFYSGEILESSNLPWHFLPTLLGLQLTEPALLLILVGIPISFLKFRNHKSLRVLLFLVMLWITIPISAVILFNSPIYGNFRQLLFVLPALFILAGLALDKINTLFHGKFAVVLFTILLIMPGLLGILRLHPFEYTYYNIFIGGEGGAANSYELDYWCTGYRKAIEFVNAEADDGASVLVSGPDHLARTFAREDLIIYADWESVPEIDYALACSRTLKGDWLYPDMDVVFSVHRGSAEYAHVKAPLNNP
jgi:hypothetical protein